MKLISNIIKRSGNLFLTYEKLNVTADNRKRDWEYLIIGLA
jgi:hypothetical protein